MASEATKILQAVSAGDRSDDEDLRGLAHAKLHASAPDHTLDPTAVVHEVFIKLIDRQDIDWRSRSHFFAVCARVMRDILVDWDSPGAVSTWSQRAIVILCSFGTPKPASCFGIRIWDPLLEDQRVLRGHTNLRGHEDYVWSLDISADGKRLVSGSGDKTVRIWETWPYSRRIQAIENAKRAAKSER